MTMPDAGHVLGRVDNDGMPLCGAGASTAGRTRRISACGEAFWSRWFGTSVSIGDGVMLRTAGDVVTSLPDTSEMPEMSLAAWRDWFTATVELLLRKLRRDRYAILLQSDIKVTRRRCGAASSGVQATSGVPCRDQQAGVPWPGGGAGPGPCMQPPNSQVCRARLQLQKVGMGRQWSTLADQCRLTGPLVGLPQATPQVHRVRHSGQSQIPRHPFWTCQTRRRLRPPWWPQGGDFFLILAGIFFQKGPP